MTPYMALFRVPNILEKQQDLGETRDSWKVVEMLGAVSSLSNETLESPNSNFLKLLIIEKIDDSASPDWAGAGLNFCSWLLNKRAGYNKRCHGCFAS